LGRKRYDAMVVIDQDPKVYEFLPGIGNRGATEAGVRRIIQQYDQHGFCLYTVELKSTHEFIGWIGLSIPTFGALD
jgi:RimJ/RimL family protein N-acetyltransferase